MSKQPPPAPTASVVGPCPTLIQISRTHYQPTKHPLDTHSTTNGLILKIRRPGRVAQSVGHLTRKSRVPYPVWQHTFVSPSAFSRSWLVGCFGFYGPLRQFFSLYRAVSQRVGERGERIEESKNFQTTPTRTYCKCL